MNKPYDQTDFEFYLKHATNGDGEATKSLLEMIRQGLCEVKWVGNNWTFMQESRFANRCAKCLKTAEAGTPQFFKRLNGKTVNYHEDCADDTIKSNSSFYQVCKAKEARANKVCQEPTTFTEV
jgi:hypothetical protein